MGDEVLDHEISSGEHVIVSFPNNNYIDHVIPETGKAADVANEISIIANTNSASTLQAVVCDGTVSNSGK